MSDKDRLIGLWRLVAAEALDGQGRPIPALGYDSGVLQYTASGHISTQIHRKDRPKFKNMEWFAGSDEEIRNAFVGYAAYFGTFDVDETAGVVIHRVQGSFFPNWEGGEQRRYYRFDGNRLILSTTPGMITDQKARGTMTWERVE